MNFADSCDCLDHLVYIITYGIISEILSTVTFTFVAVHDIYSL